MLCFREGWPRRIPRRQIGASGGFHLPYAAADNLGILAMNAGDGVAVEILERGAQEVAELVAAVACRLGLDRAPVCEVCVVGGVVEGSASYRGRITTAVQRMTPTAAVKLPAQPPVIGAAILALELAGVTPIPAIVR